MRRKPSSLLAVTGFAALSFGCSNPEVHTERAVIDDAVESISVDVGTGDVTFRGADVSNVTVEARIEGATNHLGQALQGGNLTLYDDCHENHCGVDVTATVPAGVPITLHTGTGDISVDGMLATMFLHSGTGDIAGWGLSGADLRAETGTGDVALDVTNLAENVRIRTGTGDVVLGVPSGSYRFSVSTGSGDRHVSGIDGDSNAPGLLDVVTGSGDATIHGN